MLDKFGNESYLAASLRRTSGMDRQAKRASFAISLQELRMSKQKTMNPVFSLSTTDFDIPSLFSKADLPKLPQFESPVGLGGYRTGFSQEFLSIGYNRVWAPSLITLPNIPAYCSNFMGSTDCLQVGIGECLGLPKCFSPIAVNPNPTIFMQKPTWIC
jgi:hypothetical protein